MKLGVLELAELAYNADRAVQANLVAPTAVKEWRLALAAKETWKQNVRNYLFRGTVPTLGADATRIAVFKAVLAFSKHSTLPGQVAGKTASFTAAAVNLVLDLSSDATEQINITLAADANGDTVSSETYTYSSNLPLSASVSASGLVTGLIAAAAVIITVTSSSGVQRTVTFSVQA